MTHQMKMWAHAWDFSFPFGIWWFFIQSAKKTSISVWLERLKIMKDSLVTLVDGEG